ncbi:MAG TPA: hypothetical protein VJ933_05200 [Phaeodactylibacter sp.]|nr:hypothetical protein [Phaeodactylibacter sp.]
MKQTYFEPGQFYHSYNRANGSENIFPEPENYRYILQKYKEKTTAVADMIAYCLMPNHFHLLVKIKEEKVLEAGGLGIQLIPTHTSRCSTFFPFSGCPCSLTT